ncbi:hypothetical protein D3C71_1731520 [compost metagenome]
MGDQGFDDRQLDAASGGSAHPRHHGGRQHVEIDGEVEVVATGDKGIQPVQKLGQCGLGHRLVQHVPDPQFIGAGKQRLGIGGLRHPEAGVMKRCPLSGALLGDLEEGST